MDTVYETVVSNSIWERANPKAAIPMSPTAYFLYWGSSGFILKSPKLNFFSF